ncbi:hypothetical protein AXG93_4875s1450 [Marchantia polymorpha subsp. ruderalis]|uniref:Cytochrome P450 n=1 Tax=Marchantia polymorpha subsp. ruderalis TaxID=1480154 RepID=A0A176WPJ7_MARPO|nr:hypothetical protein AXG93_4875s1450 [Marchantia polymorpha subsp. ruderalis]
MGETNIEGLFAVFKSWFVQTVAAVGFLYVVLKDMAREILKIQDHIFASRPKTLLGDLGKEMRRESLLKTMWIAFEEGHKIRCINLIDIMREMPMSITTRMVIRKGAGAHNQDCIKIMIEVTSSEVFFLEDFFPWLKLLDLSGHIKRLKMLGEKYSDIMESIIDNRLKEKTNSKSYNEEEFLDVLLTTSDFTRNQVKYLILDIILGGTNTNSDTTVWAITELLRHQSELDDVIGKERLVEEADLQQLEYPQAVVKETLRLHPTVVFGAHCPMEATKVAGYDIPANTRMIVDLYAISRDPKVWENCLEFDPSRFLNSPIDVKGQHYEVLPFSSGRRMCPGMNLGLLSVTYNLAQLVHACSITLPEGLTHLDVDVEEEFGLTLARWNPLNLLITRRPSDVYHKAGLNVIGQ